jgi:hypothetical protein
MPDPAGHLTIDLVLWRLVARWNACEINWLVDMDPGPGHTIGGMGNRWVTQSPGFRRIVATICQVRAVTGAAWMEALAAK